MRKLRLDVETLAVESFETAEGLQGRGTVEGREHYTYFCATEPECRTIGASCAPSRCYTCESCPPSGIC